jgi:hypothetical protein
MCNIGAQGGRLFVARAGGGQGPGCLAVAAGRPAQRGTGFLV